MLDLGTEDDVFKQIDFLKMSQNNYSQKEVIEFLHEPSSYPHVPGLSHKDIQVIETHAAMVFLAGDEAYKIKKDVNYSYLDFSSVEKRKKACLRELSINQPHAPQIYLDVVPITREPNGRLEINGEGTAVEWAVHMRRFGDDNLLSKALRSHRLEPVFFDCLASEIIRYHEKALKVVSSLGHAKMVAIVDQLSQAFKKTPDLFPLNDVERFTHLADSQLNRAKQCLIERSQQGYVRRCHGDLHLENIVVLDNKPVLFDAIEFNEEIATIDVLYDLAFLLMDLSQHSFEGEANRIMNGYLTKSVDINDVNGLRALPLFLSCRAGVRAMVTATRMEQGNLTNKTSDRCHAQSYFQATIDYLQPECPRLIAMGGFSGTGKTTIARDIAPIIGHFPGAVHLRTDVERKLYFGIDETTRLGQEAYTRDVNREVYCRVLEKAKFILNAGKSVVVDAAFLDPDQRKDIENVARDAQVPFRGIWLYGDEKILVKRVAGRSGDASDATPDIVRRQVQRDTGAISWKQIDAGGTMDENLARVTREIDCSITASL